MLGSILIRHEHKSLAKLIRSYMLRRYVVKLHGYFQSTNSIEDLFQLHLAARTLLQKLSQPQFELSAIHGCDRPQVFFNDSRL